MTEPVNRYGRAPESLAEKEDLVLFFCSLFWLQMHFHLRNQTPRIGSRFVWQPILKIPICIMGKKISFLPLGRVFEKSCSQVEGIWGEEKRKSGCSQIDRTIHLFDSFANPQFTAVYPTHRPCPIKTKKMIPQGFFLCDEDMKVRMPSSRKKQGNKPQLPLPPSLLPRRHFLPLLIRLVPIHLVAVLGFAAKGKKKT